MHRLFTIQTSFTSLTDGQEVKEDQEGKAAQNSRELGLELLPSTRWHSRGNLSMESVWGMAVGEENEYECKAFCS